MKIHRIYQISLKILGNFADFSPQVMACMQLEIMFYGSDYMLASN